MKTDQYTLFARVTHRTYELTKQGKPTCHRNNKAVMVLGVDKEQGFALVRWLSHNNWNSFKIALTSLREY
jgi:hypothetical protein